MRSCRIAVTLAVSLLAAGSALASTATINFDVDSTGGCTSTSATPLFNRPGYATHTAAYIASPAACFMGQLGVDNGNDSLWANAPELYVSPPFSNELRWSWVNPADNNTWLRLLTYKSNNVPTAHPSPIVYLAAPAKISMDVLIYGVDASGSENPTAAIELGLIVRETGESMPLGVKGSSTTGSLELLGVTGVGGAGGVPDPRTPVGGVTLTDSISWYHVEWVIVDSTHVDVSVDNGSGPVVHHLQVVGFPGSGDGVLSAANNRGTLDGLAIRKPVGDTLTKQWFVNVDNVVIDAPGVTDPVTLPATISDMNTQIAVSNINPSATRVNLYRNSSMLYAFATAPPANFSSGAYVFTGLTPPYAGDVITATQVVGGVESSPSQPVTVTSFSVIDDFSNGVTWTRTHGGCNYREWYEVNDQCWGAASAGTLDGSPCLRYDDPGYVNGLFCIYPAAFPATRNDYIATAKVRIVEGTNTDAIRNWEIGAEVNGTCPQLACHDWSLLAVDTATGNYGSFAGLTGADNTGTQMISTGRFSANAGDNVLIVFSTNVHSKWQDVQLDPNGALDPEDSCEGPSGFPPGRTPVRNGQGTWSINPDRTGTSGPWSGGYVLIDDIRIDTICDGCSIPVVTVSAIYCASDTTVTVNGVLPTASNVQVYAGGTELIGTTPATSGTVTVTLTRPLVAGERISATQTIQQVEGVRATAPQRTVEDCTQVPVPLVAGPLIAGATSITVQSIAANANAIEITDDGTTIASVTGGIVPGDNVVPVPPIIKGHRICARQQIGCVWSCAGSAGCKVVGSGHNSSVRLSLGVREVTGLAGPVGANGFSDSGPIEWIIPIDAGDAASGQKTGGAPMGHKVLPSGDWQTVTFDPTQLGTTANVVNFNNGNGVLNNTWVTIEHLAITMDQDARDVGPFKMYVDNVKNGAALVQDFDTTTAGVMFKVPAASGSTSQFLVSPPNVATTDAGVLDGVSGRSDRIEWCWDSEGTETVYRWVRLTTDNFSFNPYPGGSPQIRTDVPTTMRIFLPCPGPVIDVQPSPLNQTVAAGDSLVYCVSAHSVSGNPLSYQWYKGAVALADGGNISGATTSCLTIDPVLEGDTGPYTCKVSDVCGTITTNSLTLAVCVPVSITGQPANQVKNVGETATFTVTATGSGTLAYQWRKGGTNLADDTKYSGTATATLTVTNVQDPADAGSYDCVVSNGCQSPVTSNAATLTVNPATVTLSNWRSLKTHSGYGEIAIVLNAAATATGQTAGGIKVESRFSATQNGLTKVQIDVSAPVTVVDANLVTITGLSTSGCGISGQGCTSTAKAVTPTITMAAPQTLQIAFASGTAASESCYIITIQDGALSAAISGDRDCKVRVVYGDASGDGFVTLGDMPYIKFRLAQPITSANASCDVNLAGGINLGDVSTVKLRFGRRALCP